MAFESKCLQSSPISEWMVHVDEIVEQGMDFDGAERLMSEYHPSQGSKSLIFKVKKIGLLLPVVPLAADIRTIFQAPNRKQVEVYLKQIVTKYASSASDLAIWLEVSIPEGVTVFDFPVAHRRWSQSAMGFTAGTWLTLFWLAGIELVCALSRLPIPWKPAIYIWSASIFLIFHTGHAWLVYSNLVR